MKGPKGMWKAAFTRIFFFVLAFRWKTLRGNDSSQLGDGGHLERGEFGTTRPRVFRSGSQRAATSVIILQQVFPAKQDCALSSAG
jgi:hypothetical protein